MASDFKTALDAAMVELETGPTTTKAVAVSAPAVTVEQRGEEKKEEEEVAVVEDLFKAADFFPAEDVKQEVELSFEGQGLKLNTEEDAKGRKQVWDKERVSKITLEIYDKKSSRPECKGHAGQLAI